MTSKIISPGSGELLSVLGHKLRVLLSGKDTGEAFALIDQTSPAGACVPPHFHQNEEETFYVIAGRVEFSLNGDAVIAEPGGTVYAARRMVHSFRVLGDETARMLVLVTPAGVERLFRELAALPSDRVDPVAAAAISERYGVVFV
jgi:quercetin dioxygenase-like cupin family protein